MIESKKEFISTPLAAPTLDGGSRAGGSDATSEDTWAKAFGRLTSKDPELLNNLELGMLVILKGIQTETGSKKLCEDKAWRVYWNKNGEEVKLRHVLEKISVWVTEIIKIVDFGVSFDKSGYAALPWGIVKLIITVGNQTSSPANARFSGLITGYTVIEMLYLREDNEATQQLREYITTLYTAILFYLVEAKAYFSGSKITGSGKTRLVSVVINKDCTRLILELTHDNPATIAIDAPDECQEGHRHKLLKALDRIISESREVVKVFVSSREDVDIGVHIRKSQIIPINASKNDIDIAHFIESKVEELSSEGLLLDGKITAGCLT
ncbi:hypothetical protein G7Y89_g15600 [Cudoniella acicularis]|uniref:Nephrocystin 3-like N-terminal domain-containing protein n=1 Tax=Cudoniella acicularis TaxID=354080 RepID=A0A8H4VLQ5_9HELO|nr:hypothetical protein G7Y89_g15600 [Cudoniella acicularis]